MPPACPRAAVLAAVVAAGACGVGAGADPVAAADAVTFCRSDGPARRDPPFRSITQLVDTQRSCLQNHIDYLAPLGVWRGVPVGNVSNVFDRIATAYALTVETGGILLVADALLQNFIDGNTFSDALLAYDLNATRLRGNAGWEYGEDRVMSSSIAYGFFHRAISDRGAWPDPVCAAQQPFWSCPFFSIEEETYYQTTWKPNLLSTVWAGMIGPLHVDWTKHMMTAGAAAHLPEETNAFRLIGTLVGVLRDSAAQIGGFYESPQVSGESAPLYIHLKSNLILLKALQMTDDAFAEDASPNLHSQVRMFMSHIRSLLTYPGYPTWDIYQAAFVTKLTIAEPYARPGEYAQSEWDPETQLVAIATLGAEINTLPYPQYEGAAAHIRRRMAQMGCEAGPADDEVDPYRAYSLYYLVRDDYGVRDVAGSLMGFSREVNGRVPDHDLTMLGIIAASEMYRIYKNGSECIYRMYLADVQNMRDAMLDRAGCDVLPNVTGAECNRSYAGPPRYGWRGSNGLPSLYTTAWGVVVEAALNASQPFSPFVLPAHLPFPKPSDSDGMPALWQMLAAMCGFGVLLILLGAATKVRSHRAAQSYPSVLHVEGATDPHLRSIPIHREYGTH